MDDGVWAQYSSFQEIQQFWFGCWIKENRQQLKQYTFIKMLNTENVCYANLFLPLVLILPFYVSAPIIMMIWELRQQELQKTLSA